LAFHFYLLASFQSVAITNQRQTADFLLQLDPVRMSVSMDTLSITLDLHDERINYGFIHAIYKQNELLLTCALNVYVNPASMKFPSSRSP
jgi:hypothetical protein